MNRDEIVAELFRLQDKKYAEMQTRIIPTRLDADSDSPKKTKPTSAAATISTMFTTEMVVASRCLVDTAMRNMGISVRPRPNTRA